MMKGLLGFAWFSLRSVSRGGPLYWGWIAVLLALVTVGVLAYAEQLEQGLLATNMRDPVSWGFYIGNFTFLVGVAAAAVVLVIPAYVYGWKPIKEIVLIGELLAISAIIMCLLFVMVDLGRPERFFHLLPFFGTPNFPGSILSWDVLVLNLYLILNVVLASHVLYSAWRDRPYRRRLVLPLVLLSIPAAVAIHTVTAFLYSGLAARPYWHAAILAPRFLASAFCAGPAIILVLLQILRRFAGLRVQDAALWKIAELMAYAMFINLFLLGAEVFSDYYADTHHLIHFEYLFTGVGGSSAIVLYAWLGIAFSVAAFLLFLIPKTRRNIITLNIGAALIYAGMYIEKGIALVIPGFTPSPTGQIYEYAPSSTELRVAAGVFALGFLLLTLMMKVAIPLMQRRTFTGEPATDTASDPATDPVAEPVALGPDRSPAAASGATLGVAP